MKRTQEKFKDGFILLCFAGVPLCVYATQEVYPLFSNTNNILTLVDHLPGSGGAEPGLRQWIFWTRFDEIYRVVWRSCLLVRFWQIYSAHGIDTRSSGQRVRDTSWHPLHLRSRPAIYVPIVEWHFRNHKRTLCAIKGLIQDCGGRGFGCIERRNDKHTPM